jgi:hypothetical protein
MTHLEGRGAFTLACIARSRATAVLDSRRNTHPHRTRQSALGSFRDQKWGFS